MQVSSGVNAYEARLGDVVKGVKDVLRRRYLVLVGIALAVTILGYCTDLCDCAALSRRGQNPDRPEPGSARAQQE